MAVDYSNRIRCAEEVVVTVVDDILTEGGHMLWQKYLQRKAFPFAAETATDALVSQLRMCYVAHDRGEPDYDSDQENWGLEEEPVPAEVDNWARMQLGVRRNQGKFVTDMSPSARPARKMQTLRTRGSNAPGREKKEEKKLPESRSFDLKEDMQLDDEEEKLRDARHQEELKRRDREKKVKENEKQQEIEQQRVEALHEEMARRNHTFDSEGGLIWVEDLKLDRLPRVQEVFPYFVKRDAQKKGAGGEDEKKGKPGESPAGKKQQRGKGRKFDRSLKGKGDEDEFPDGYSKLQHGQPPIQETMVVKPGVVLDAYGKSKAGPPVLATGVGMSRKEYVALTEKEVAYEAQFNSIDPGPDSPGSPDGPGLGGTAGSLAGGLGDRGLDGGMGDTLPPIGGAGGGAGGGARRPHTTGGVRGGTGGHHAKTGGMDDGKKGEVQTAPPAPSMNVRAKKMQAIGHLGQPPRLHVAPLGGPYGFGVAQPPLGATMGHGLVRHGSLKESYFFPHPGNEMPSLLRATSDTSIGPKGRGNKTLLAALPLSRGVSREESRSQTAPAFGSPSVDGGSVPDEESPRHGMIRPEKKSQAYRGMRQTLFPKSISQGYTDALVV